MHQSKALAFFSGLARMSAGCHECCMPSVITLDNHNSPKSSIRWWMDCGKLYFTSSCGIIQQLDFIPFLFGSINIHIYQKPLQFWHIYFKTPSYLWVISPSWILDFCLNFTAMTSSLGKERSEFNQVVAAAKRARRCCDAGRELGLYHHSSLTLSQVLTLQCHHLASLLCDPQMV